MDSSKDLELMRQQVAISELNVHNSTYEFQDDDVAAAEMLLNNMSTDDFCITVRQQIFKLRITN